MLLIVSLIHRVHHLIMRLQWQETRQTLDRKVEATPTIATPSRTRKSNNQDNNRVPNNHVSMVGANQGKKCSKDRPQLEAFPLITTITTKISKVKKINTITTIITTITCTKVSKVKKINKVAMTEVIKVTARLTVPVTTPREIPCATKTVIATRAMYTPPEPLQVKGVSGIIPEATPVKTTPPVKGQ